MRKLARSATLIVALSSPSLSFVPSAFAQAGAAPATATFPAPPSSAPAAEPAPNGASEAQVTCNASPAPAAPPPSAPAYPPPPAYQGDPDLPRTGGYPGGGYGEPPPPPRDPNEGFKVPDISLRIDPFNFLLEGRLGLELETQVYKFLTIEVVPVFVTTHSPPTLNYASYEDSIITQSSNGVGAVSGAAIDAGFWFGRRPLEGNVLRVGFSNYSYTYDTKDNGVAVDSVSHTDREIFAMFGQHNRWGAFTIAGGIGLGYELNKQNRCFDDLENPVSSCPKDETLIRLDNTGSVANLNGFLYPFDLLARFSLGVVF